MLLRVIMTGSWFFALFSPGLVCVLAQLRQESVR